MNSRKQIEVGASAALIELKAELLRKQTELRAQPSARGVSKSLNLKNEPKGVAKLTGGRNPGIEKRQEKDEEEKKLAEVSYDRAKYVLEQKAKLYEQMNQEALTYDESHPVLANSLVDFQRKAIDKMKEDRLQPPSSSKKDSKWTEFTDSFGRTRRILKSELAAYIAADKELRKELEPVVESERSEPSEDEIIRLQKHEKWEQQAAALSEKSKVHYQDILFDEIREHGTGYYEFSKDDEERAVQLAQLKKLSQETEASRNKIEEEKKGKKAELKERLRKIRARKRAKLGLSPKEEESESEEDEKVDVKGEEKTAVEEEKPKSSSSLPPEIRPWDYRKPGVFGPQPANFDELDEKWLKDRRTDRKSDFAPPKYYSKPYPAPSHAAGNSSSGSKYSNFVKAEQITVPPPPPTTRKLYVPNSQNKPQTIKPIQDEMPAPTPLKDFERGRGTEIAPPPTFEYYHGESSRKRPATEKKSNDNVSDAISQGLENIRKQFEDRESKSKRRDLSY